VVGGHGITGHDFTGRWLGECHAIRWRSYVLHVSCTASRRERAREDDVETGEAGGGGRGLNRERKRGEGVSAQCDGEHSIRKQMSLPKHASCPAYLSEEFIREEERGALSMKKNAVDGEQKERERGRTRGINDFRAKSLFQMEIRDLIVRSPDRTVQSSAFRRVSSQLARD